MHCMSKQTYLSLKKFHFSWPFLSNTTHLYGKYSMRVCMCKMLMQHKAKLSYIFICTSKGSALNDILYFLVVFHWAIFSSTQTTDFSKCSSIQFVVGETIV